MVLVFNDTMVTEAFNLAAKITTAHLEELLDQQSGFLDTGIHGDH